MRTIITVIAIIIIALLASYLISTLLGPVVPAGIITLTNILIGLSALYGIFLAVTGRYHLS